MKTKRHPYVDLSARTCARAAALIMLRASVAGAQIGGPTDARPVGATTAKAPASASGRVEREGVRVDFSAKATGAKGLTAAGPC